jgi:hypothetical protein
MLHLTRPFHHRAAKYIQISSLILDLVSGRKDGQDILFDGQVCYPSYFQGVIGLSFSFLVKKKRKRESSFL